MRGVKIAVVLSTLLDLHQGRAEAEVEAPYGVGHVALRAQRA
jgi:hypothetical protein